MLCTLNHILDVRCDNLSASANAEIISCTGRVGVGYEGDTCSFTCNTGYEITGSDTRTCQSDGSWSGNDDVCRKGNVAITNLYCANNGFHISVSCSSLANPNNRITNCSLGDDGVPFYEDTCSFTCNTGYELAGIGGDTRTCQSNGSWSGSDDVCRRGRLEYIMLSVKFLVFFPAILIFFTHYSQNCS